MKLLLVALTVFAVSCSASVVPEKESKVQYENFAVFKLYPENEIQRAIIKKLSALREHFDLWRNNKEEMHLMVSPNYLEFFKNLTSLQAIKNNLWLKNVQDLIQKEKPSSQKKSSFGWTSYHDLNEIEAFMDDILATYPEVTEEFIVGKSYEGRTIRGIKISYKAGNPAIFIQSNIHANEWITSATATYLIHQLLTSDKPEVRALAQQQDWYILPVFNVDGFHYAHTVDRMWRKNRRPNEISSCIGTDLNRNYDWHWMESDGASSDPCDKSYAGVAPNSEVETVALTKFLTSIKDKMNMFLTFHSYSQLVLYPYGNSSTYFPKNVDDLRAVSQSFVDAIAAYKYNTNYTAITEAALYPATGTTIDWVYETLNVPMTLTFEFRDRGEFGFLLPAEQILGNAEEVLEGFVNMVQTARDLKYLEPKN